MSKWVNATILEEFEKEKTTEAVKDENKPSSNFRKWPTPAKGTPEKGKEYEIRFLPDKEGNPKYRKMYYHMFKAGEKWSFSLCPKTYDFECWCPVCAVAGKLYQGSANDKVQAKALKRKEKFVQNILVVDDPRDAEQNDAEMKVVGKVMLYEFPQKVEEKLKKQLADKKRGLGGRIFDPSENGHNFILDVKSTKATGDGNSFADYSNSEFTRDPKAIADTDEGIQAIIDQTYILDDYIKTLEKTEDQIIELLKGEMFFELIEEDYERRQKASSKKTDASKAEAPAEKAEEKAEAKAEPKKEEKKASKKEEAADSSDDALLDELRNM